MKRPIPALEKGFWKAESKRISQRFAELSKNQAWSDEPAGLISGRREYIGAVVVRERTTTTRNNDRRHFRIVTKRPNKPTQSST